MSPRVRRLLLASGLSIVCVVGIAAGVSSQAGTPYAYTTKNGEWPSYTGDVRGSKYSALDQISADNFSKLEIAWRFKTDSLGTRPEYKLEGTPLMVRGVLYATAGTRRSVVALDAATGELLWVHGEHDGRRGAAAPRQLSGRGLAYWTDGTQDRILYYTPGYAIVAFVGEFGNDTWLNNSWDENGNTGVWTQITVDEDLGLAYLPVETPTSDYYGGHRPGDNLFAESLVCVDLKTGQRKWHVQLVHHPLWDMDISSAPILADINVDGKAIKAVAHPSKQ